MSSPALPEPDAIAAQRRAERRRRRRLAWLALLLLLFGLGLWSLAQANLPEVDADPPPGAEPPPMPGELPVYHDPPRADGDRPGWDDDSPPGLRPSPVAPPRPSFLASGSAVGTNANATAPATASARRGPRAMPMGMRYPGRVAPAKQLPAGRREVDWSFVYQGQTYNVHSAITVDDGDGLRRPAHVSTYDDQGNLLVSYDGTAFLDRDGIAEVDARNAAVSGPMADDWSPDSFAIDQYGYMHSLDDVMQTGSGWKSAATK
jgi:hypothetical protein